MTQNTPYHEAHARVDEALHIEAARLRAIGSKTAANTLDALRSYPDSMVRLYDILTKGAGNA